MIRAKFGHSRYGKVFQRGDEIDNLTEAERVEAVYNGLAYYDSPKVEFSPSMDYKKDEIQEYLTNQGIEFDDDMTKSELIELC